jgi:hypothetical protein
MGSDWQREAWARMRENDRRTFDVTGKAVVTGETDAEALAAAYAVYLPCPECGTELSLDQGNEDGEVECPTCFNVWVPGWLPPDARA